MRLLVGGYSADMDGHAEGIGALRAGAADEPSAGGTLAYAGTLAAAASPSWITRHPALDVVYAALEKRGEVQAFRRTGEEAYEPLGAPVPAGEAVCHVAVAPDGRSLLAACWGDGRVVRIALAADGTLSQPSVAPTSEDPHPAASFGEPRPSRAHQARFLDRGLVATTDLGHDAVRLWRTDAAGLTPHQSVALPAGSGPRHMVWHPSGHLYVVTELSGEVFALAPERTGRWRIVAGLPLGAMPGDTGAELAVSRDGETLYAGLRGSNTLAAVRVRGDGSQLHPVALVEAGVDWPRHHLVIRDTLLVAGQRSDDVVSMTLDPRTGVPGRVRSRTSAPSPTCLVPLA
ncbi:lactonase family protein [Microbacterium aureliae]